MIPFSHPGYPALILTHITGSISKFFELPSNTLLYHLSSEALSPDLRKSLQVFPLLSTMAQPSPSASQPGPTDSSAAVVAANREYQEIMQTPPHLRRQFPAHLQGVRIPYRPVNNLQAGPAASTPPPRRLLPPPLIPDMPADFVPLPPPAFWWEYADDRLSGSTTRPYDMSMTETLGHIRYKMDGPWWPVIANITCMCPCYLRHGENCAARPPIQCHSIPEFHEVCFKPRINVSACSFLHASIAAICTSAGRTAWERCTSQSAARSCGHVLWGVLAITGMM